VSLRHAERGATSRRVGDDVVLSRESRDSSFDVLSAGDRLDGMMDDRSDIRSVGVHRMTM